MLWELGRRVVVVILELFLRHRIGAPIATVISPLAVSTSSSADISHLVVIVYPIRR